MLVTSHWPPRDIHHRFIDSTTDVIKARTLLGGLGLLLLLGLLGLLGSLVLGGCGGLHTALLLHPVPTRSATRQRPTHIV